MILMLSLLFSCNNHSEKIIVQPKTIRNGDKLILKADLKATYTNFSNPRDRNFYYLIDLHLINNSNKECEFYTLICGSLVNIITDSRQVNFLYHNCSADLASLIKLKPGQEYSVSAILVRNKYISTFNPSVRFGFIISRPKAGPVTNHAIVTELKSLREKPESAIWSDPVILTATNSYTYEIKDIIKDSVYSVSY
jgi:hypothetical protein